MDRPQAATARGLKRVLVVDDNERVLFVLRRTLLGLGERHEIVTAQSGREALGKAEAAPFDLVITDLRMPDVDGVALTEALRELNGATVVIWMTAYGCYKVAAEAARLSVYGCLDKPLKVSEIRQVARRALEESDGGNRGRAGRRPRRPVPSG